MSDANCCGPSNQINIHFDSFMYMIFATYYVDIQSKKNINLEKSKRIVDGGNEDHVWFEDRWMVASLCDE
jgi:hypothetical protein